MAAGDKEVRTVKLAFREGRIGDYALYLAPADWTDEDALAHGIKVTEHTARCVMFILGWYRNEGLVYRE